MQLGSLGENSGLRRVVRILWKMRFAKQIPSWRNYCPKVYYPSKSLLASLCELSTDVLRDRLYRWAEWRRRRPSMSQLSMLESMGYPDTGIIPGVTADDEMRRRVVDYNAGQVSDMCISSCTNTHFPCVF